MKSNSLADLKFFFYLLKPFITKMSMVNCTLLGTPCNMTCLFAIFLLCFSELLEKMLLVHLAMICVHMFILFT